MTEHEAPLCTITSWLHHCVLLSTPFDWQLNLSLHKQYKWIVCPWMALSIHFAACFWLSVSLPGPAKPFITFSNTLIFLMLCGSIDALSGTHLTWKLLTPGCLYAREHFLRRIMTVYVVYHICSPSEFLSRIHTVTLVEFNFKALNPSLHSGCSSAVNLHESLWTTADGNEMRLCRTEL